MAISVECLQCEKSFLNPRKHLLHLPECHYRSYPKTQIDDDQYFCRRCPLKFTNLSSLNYHKEVHAMKNSFTCQSCQGLFSTQRAMIMHYTKEHVHKKPQSRPSPAIRWEAGTPFMCFVCRKTFPSFSLLKVHRVQHLPASVPVHPEYVYKSGHFFQWNAHRILHRGDSRRPCQRCPIKLRSAAWLEIHEETHRNEVMPMQQNMNEMSKAGQKVRDADSNPRVTELAEFVNDPDDRFESLVHTCRSEWKEPKFKTKNRDSSETSNLEQLTSPNQAN